MTVVILEIAKTIREKGYLLTLPNGEVILQGQVPDVNILGFCSQTETKRDQGLFGRYRRRIIGEFSASNGGILLYVYGRDEYRSAEALVRSLEDTFDTRIPIVTLESKLWEQFPTGRYN